MRGLGDVLVRVFVLERASRCYSSFTTGPAPCFVPLRPCRYGVDVALGLKEYPPLTRLLRYPTHKELAVKIVQRVRERGSSGLGRGAARGVRA